MNLFFVHWTAQYFYFLFCYIISNNYLPINNFLMQGPQDVEKVFLLNKFKLLSK